MFAAIESLLSDFHWFIDYGLRSTWATGAASNESICWQTHGQH